MRELAKNLVYALEDVIISYNKRISHISFLLRQHENAYQDQPDDFVSSLVRNYGSSNNYSSSDKPIGEIWRGATSASRGLILHYLNESVSELNKCLNRMFETQLINGFDQGHVVAQAIMENADSARHIGTVTIDKLLLLAQSLAVIPYYNPEQGNWTFDGDIDAMLDKIQGEIDFDISFPSFYGGVYGIPTKFGTMTDRALMAIFIANSMKKIIDMDKAVCEIGGGSGMQAYYMWKAGFRRLAVVDLPEVGMCQAYFLHRNIKEASIILDDCFRSSRDREGTIGIFRPERFYEATRHKWDAIINVDSFPEMPKQFVLDYISKCVENRWPLVSINQEAATGDQNIVPLICAGFPLLQRVLRAPFWMRLGYVIEHYEPAKIGTLSRIGARLLTLRSSIRRHTDPNLANYNNGLNCLSYLDSGR